MKINYNIYSICNYNKLIKNDNLVKLIDKRCVLLLNIKNENKLECFKIYYNFYNYKIIILTYEYIIKKYKNYIIEKKKRNYIKSLRIAKKNINYY
jgi:hypothetical protein